MPEATLATDADVISAKPIQLASASPGHMGVEVVLNATATARVRQSRGDFAYEFLRGEYLIETDLSLPIVIIGAKKFNETEARELAADLTR